MTVSYRYNTGDWPCLEAVRHVADVMDQKVPPEYRDRIVTTFGRNQSYWSVGAVYVPLKRGDSVERDHRRLQKIFRNAQKRNDELAREYRKTRFGDLA